MLTLDVFEEFLRIHGDTILELVTSFVVWNEEEAGWQRLFQESKTAPRTKLKKGIENMLRKSLAGSLISKFNSSEPEDEFVIGKKVELAQNKEFPLMNRRHHDFTENFEFLLEKVFEDGTNIKSVTIDDFLKNLSSLRVRYHRVTHMDSSLLKYKALQALSITANFLREVRGSDLPRQLKFLELYGNQITGTKKLSKDAPPLLLYLGLGRNYLYKISSIKNLANLVNLHYLELSDNDLDNIDEVLEALKLLTKLKCLSLLGNPCSMPKSYTQIVQTYLPDLEVLDGNILTPNVVFPTRQLIDRNAYLQIFGFRFMAVPPHDMEFSRSKGFYQLEAELPLLDEELFREGGRQLLKQINYKVKDYKQEEPLPKGVENIIPKKCEKDVSPSKNPSETSVEGEAEQEWSGKTDAEKCKILRAYSRWLEKDKELPRTAKFYSNKVTWAPIITFKNPCIEVPVKPEMFKRLRDTLRSVITIRLYYKEMSTSSRSPWKPGRPGTSTPTGRFSPKKKSRSRSRDRERSTSSREYLSIRNLVAKIRVPLEITNWKDPIMGYIWDCDLDRCLARRYPGIERVAFLSNRNMKPASSTSKGSRTSRMSRMSRVASRQSRQSNQGRTSDSKKRLITSAFPYPDLMTGHIGAGLKRTDGPKQKSTVVEDSKKNKRVSVRKKSMFIKK